MRHALLGGSFDPFHRGHAWLVDAALVHAGCGRVWVVPAARPPHKPGVPLTEFRHRLAMCRAALDGRTEVTVSDCEAAREGWSYTVDTLRRLRQAVAPGDDWVVVVGSDMAADFPTWREPDAIRAMARLAVAARPGAAVVEGPGDVLRLPGTPPDVSATEIRRRVAAGEPFAHLVPAPVARYIDEHGLYRGTANAGPRSRGP
jgi:nicotinate-nucleotide adenylyltransferase